MNNPQHVVFGGSDLDRAAHLRNDVDALLTQTSARILLIWRGKVLTWDMGGLVLLPADHPALQIPDDPRLFLGLGDQGTPYFAQELRSWAPIDEDEMVGAFVDTSRQRHPEIANAGFAELRSVMADLPPREAELAATARGLFEWHRSHRFCARCGAKTQMTMGGWQRECGDCGGDHFPRTDPVVIMLITYGNAVLVGRSPGWPDGMYSLLAGFVEPGETMESAVRREVFEEAGIRVGEVTYLASQPWPFPSSLMFGCAGIATSRDITIDPAEIEDALWITREEMADVFAGQHPVMNPPRKGAIAGFLLENWLADCLK